MKWIEVMGFYMTMGSLKTVNFFIS